MVGAAYKGVEWDKTEKALVVNIEKHTANEGLARVLDFGAKQFEKMAEAYGGSLDQLMNSGMTRFYDTAKRRLAMIARLKVRKEDGFFAVMKSMLFR